MKLKQIRSYYLQAKSSKTAKQFPGKQKEVWVVMKTFSYMIREQLINTVDDLPIIINILAMLDVIDFVTKEVEKEEYSPFKTIRSLHTYLEELEERDVWSEIIEGFDASVECGHYDTCSVLPYYMTSTIRMLEILIGGDNDPAVIKLKMDNLRGEFIGIGEWVADWAYEMEDTDYHKMEDSYNPPSDNPLSIFLCEGCGAEVNSFSSEACVQCKGRFCLACIEEHGGYKEQHICLNCLEALNDNRDLSIQKYLNRGESFEATSPSGNIDEEDNHAHMKSIAEEIAKSKEKEAIARDMLVVDPQRNFKLNIKLS